AAADTGLEAAAGRVTLLAPVVAEVRRADHRAPRLELAAAALPDDVVRHARGDGRIPQVVAARELALEADRELERVRLVVAAARPSERAAHEVERPAQLDLRVRIGA